MISLPARADLADAGSLALAWLAFILCLPLFVVAFAARVAVHWTLAGWDAAEKAL